MKLYTRRQSEPIGWYSFYNFLCMNDMVMPGFSGSDYAKLYERIKAILAPRGPKPYLTMLLSGILKACLWRKRPEEDNLRQDGAVKRHDGKPHICLAPGMVPVEAHALIVKTSPEDEPPPEKFWIAGAFFSHRPKG